ncbi:MAG: phage head morphogenesis protein, partial [Phycisphaerae bacterium]|nr:phage head morphogenesis protein [Phycisphaerae bacterium]
RIDKIKAVRSGQQIFAWFAIEDHPAIQEMLRERAEKMIKYVEKGVPLNQVIDAGDLPFEHVDWGNDWWVSAGMVPAREIMEGGLDASIGEDLPEGETDEPEDGDKGITPADNPDPIIEQKKARILQKYYASFSPLEKQYIAKIRNYHRRQKTEMIARLEEALGDSKSIQNSELKIKNSTDIVAKVVFDLTTENGKLRAFHKVFYTEGIELGAAQTISEVAGTAGSDLAAAAKQASRSAAAKQSIVRSIKKVQKINQTTKNRISKTLFDGLEKGEGLNDLARRISKDASFSMARAKRIARTSTSSAVSSGRFEGLKTVGAELKRWLSARNEAVRKTHRNADSQYTQTPIPVGQKFTVGSALLMYPGDPSGPAEEVANCRCMILAAKAKGKAITLDHYDRRVKFVEYAELKTLLSED